MDEALEDIGSPRAEDEHDRQERGAEKQRVFGIEPRYEAFPIMMPVAGSIYPQSSNHTVAMAATQADQLLHRAWTIDRCSLEGEQQDLNAGLILNLDLPSRPVGLA